MKQLVFTEPGTLEWQETPDPQPGPGQAVVRPLAVARCDLDIAMAAFGIFPGPLPVGHEIAGEPNQAKAGAAFGFGASGGGHGGGVAELLLVPDADHMLVPAPESISDVALGCDRR